MSSSSVLAAARVLSRHHSGTQAHAERSAILADELRRAGYLTPPSDELVAAAQRAAGDATAYDFDMRASAVTCPEKWRVLSSVWLEVRDDTRFTCSSAVCLYTTPRQGTAESSSVRSHRQSSLSSSSSSSSSSSDGVYASTWHNIFTRQAFCDKCMQAERRKEKPRIPCAVPSAAEFFAQLPRAPAEEVATAPPFCWIELGYATDGLRCCGAKNCGSQVTMALRLYSNVLCTACFAGRAKLTA